VSDKDPLECKTCVVDVGTGFALKICKDALPKVDCEGIAKDFSAGKITREQLFTRIKEGAQNEPDVLADVEEIERLSTIRTKIDKDPKI
jgi:hypothetical protein